MVKIALNRLVKRQTPKSKYSHFTGTDSELLKLIEQNFPIRISGEKINKAGESHSYVIVPLQTKIGGKDMFYTSIVPISSRNLFHCEFASRTDSEEQRVCHSIYGNKIPGKYAEAILFPRSILDKNLKASTEDADYEVVSLNVSPTETATPLHPYDLLRTYKFEHAKFSGSNIMNEVMKSIDFWSKHAVVRSAKRASPLENADQNVLAYLMEGNKVDAVKYLTGKGLQVKAATTEVEKLMQLLSERVIE